MKVADCLALWGISLVRKESMPILEMMELEKRVCVGLQTRSSAEERIWGEQHPSMVAVIFLHQLSLHSRGLQQG